MGGCKNFGRHGLGVFGMNELQYLQWVKPSSWGLLAGWLC